MVNRVHVTGTLERAHRTNRKRIVPSTSDTYPEAIYIPYLHQNAFS